MKNSKPFKKTIDKFYNKQYNQKGYMNEKDINMSNNNINSNYNHRYNVCIKQQ